MSNKENMVTTSTVSRVNEVVFTEIDGHVVLMNLESGLYHSIDEIGGRIWSLMENPILISEICLQLRGIFDVGEKQCEQDVLFFIQGLVDRNLARVITF